jgi:hypothetical protein
MKTAIIVIAGIMATAGPVFADEGDKINYLIKYVSSDKAKDQVLKDFNMYDIKDSSKYKNDLFKTPKLTIIDGEDKDLYKKAK